VTADSSPGWLHVSCIVAESTLSTDAGLFKIIGRGRVRKRGVLVGVVLPGLAEKGLPHGW
jgi:hypothetical protein